jgi:hypothetical protein
MPGKRSKHQHMAKADRMAQHIEKSAREEGRYKGREERVVWGHGSQGNAERRGPQEIIQLSNEISKGNAKEDPMANVEKTIEVKAPLSTVYKRATSSGSRNSSKSGQ